jgi:hypothetical protein
MSNDESISDDDITTGPTEDDENLDVGGEHARDTGDESSESDDDRSIDDAIGGI